MSLYPKKKIGCHLHRMCAFLMPSPHRTFFCCPRLPPSTPSSSRPTILRKGRRNVGFFTGTRQNPVYSRLFICICSRPGCWQVSYLCWAKFVYDKTIAFRGVPPTDGPKKILHNEIQLRAFEISLSHLTLSSLTFLNLFSRRKKKRMNHRRTFPPNNGGPLSLSGNDSLSAVWLLVALPFPFVIASGLWAISTVNGPEHSETENDSSREVWWMAVASAAHEPPTIGGWSASTYRSYRREPWTSNERVIFGLFRVDTSPVHD